MKNKYLSIIFGATCILTSVFMNTKTSAFLGNAHYYMSEQVLEKFQKENNIELSEEEKNSFKSGSVMAHIGRFDMDNKEIIDSETNDTRHVISRSEEFVDELMSQAKLNNNKRDVWFALGAHITRDQDEGVSQVLDSLENFKESEELDDFKKYYLKCGIVESYFCDKLSRSINCANSSENFNLKQVGHGIFTDEELEQYSSYAPLFFMIYFLSVNSDNLLLNEDLIVNTYKKLGLEITAEDVKKQAANLVGSSAILSYISQSFIEEPEKSQEIKSENLKLVSDTTQEITKKSKLDKSIDNLVNLCVEKLKTLTDNIDFEKLN